MTREKMAKVMDVIFAKCHSFRNAGQKEYAQAEDNAFANFERIGKALGLDRKIILQVYMLKHMDGINSFIKGHKSQREDVRGRICDAIVYLCLLYGMIDQEEDTLNFEITTGGTTGTITVNNIPADPVVWP